MVVGVYGRPWQEGICGKLVHGRGACVAGDILVGGHTWQRVCMVGGVHGRGGHVYMSGEMATAVDGIILLELHSCSYLLMFLLLIAVRYFPDSVNSKAI